MHFKPIILLGETSSGKTPTFQLLRQRLLEFAQESNYTQLGANEFDFEAVYTTENRRLYVCSMGESERLL